MMGTSISIPEIRNGTLVGPGSQFGVSGIQPGTYTLRASMINYKTEELRDLDLKANEIVIVDFVLDTLFVDTRDIQ